MKVADVVNQSSMPPVANQPARKVHGAVHFIADLTLPYGRVVHDYKAAG
jgi:acetoacetate decarboxylase